MTDNLDQVRQVLNEAQDVDMDGVPMGDAPHPDARFDGGDLPPPRDESDVPALPVEEGAQHSLNDTGNALRFALYYGTSALYVPRVGWHVWDERRWKLDPDGLAVQRIAQGVQHAIMAEIPYLKLNGAERRKVNRLDAIRSRLMDLKGDLDEGQREERDKLTAEKDRITGELWGRGSTRQRHQSFARSAGNSNTLGNMMKEAQPHLARDVEELDSDPLTVNCLSGVLRFTVHDMTEEGGGRQADVTRLDHARVLTVPGRNRPQYITKMIPIEYDPNATCPRFDAFLARVQPDPAMRAFLARWFGLSMTALPVQKFLYMYGMGANGKSLLAGLMRRMLGDYATMVRIESLTGQNRRGGSDATPDMMKLIGARAAITNEPEEGERLQEQKVKELTGGDAMMVRALHSDFVEFTPYFKLTFTGNHKLEIRGTDDGIWRRPLLTPFDIQIPEGERDEKLGDNLFHEEGPGILNWMIGGLIDYLQGGLQEPPLVLEATREYRADSDPIGDFLGSATVMDRPTDWMSARDLIDACYLYQMENAGAAWTPGTLSRRLKERAGTETRPGRYRHPVSGKGFMEKKSGVNGYAGVRLTDDMRSRLDNAPRDSKGIPLPAKAGASTSSAPPDTGDF